MESHARKDLTTALVDVEALLTQAQSYAGGKRGAPQGHAGAGRPGRPFTRAATVMLAGATEAFFEALALEAAGQLNLTSAQEKDLKDAVSRMHGIGTDKVHALFAMLGCPFILDGLGWKGLPKGSVRARLAGLHLARNKIAHGNAPKNAQVVQVRGEIAFVVSLAKAMDNAVAARIGEVKGTPFNW